MRPAWVEVNTGALRENTRKLKACLHDGVDFMAIVKADAYGHGAIKVVEILKEEGINKFAVVIIEEGIELRESGIDDPILIIGYIPEEEYPILIKYNLTPAIYKYSQAKELNKIAKDMGKIIDIHIKTDTGMARFGFPASMETIDEIQKISLLSNINIDGIYSHLATSDERSNPYVHIQFDKFKFILEELEKRDINIPIKHISNSAATINFKEMNLDMVRPGTSIYGLYPGPEMLSNPTIELEAVMSVKAKLAHIKEIQEGDFVGYGSTFTAKRKTKIGIIPMGYVDGMYRRLGNRGEVLIRGKRCPIVGNICMDNFMVDLTDLDKVSIGDEVVIFGRQGKERISAEEVAEIAGTHSVEVINRIGKRMPRIYI